MECAPANSADRLLLAFPLRQREMFMLFVPFCLLAREDIPSRPSKIDLVSNSQVPFESPLAS
jgi:hypothetical protein